MENEVKKLIASVDSEIKEYLELAKQKEELEMKMNTLKESIAKNINRDDGLELPMTSESTYTTEDNSATVTLSSKETIKYSDETAIISILEEKGLNQFVTKKVVTTSLNKELKKGGMITESLKGLYTTTSTVTTTIKSK